jgi:Icc protein
MRTLRLIHLTDIHLQPEGGISESSLRNCFRRIHSMEDRPDLILNGGDSVRCVLRSPSDDAAAQARLWKRIVLEECTLPIEHCIGNHDTWGWNRAASNSTGNERLWGKAFAMDLYGLQVPYRSFDRGGWHFIILDSTHPCDGKHNYTAKLDEPQFEWLARDLASVPSTTPILILSHIPILGVCPFLDGPNEESGDWIVPGQWMHIDARRILELFRNHRNIRLCLSGHIHLADRCEYEGITYLCNGALCGKWWKGDYHGTPPGFAVIDLFDNGDFTSEYLPHPHG